MFTNELSRYRSINKPTTILLVDDDLGDCELTKRALKSAGPNVVLMHVSNGEEAMAYLLASVEEPASADRPHPDIVLLDINMPKLGGKGVMRELRANPKLRGLPVVALTTSNDSKDVQDMYDLGVNSYITKPSAMEQFKESLTSLLNFWFQTASLPKACS